MRRHEKRFGQGFRPEQLTERLLELGAFSLENKVVANGSLEQFFFLKDGL